MSGKWAGREMHLQITQQAITTDNKVSNKSCQNNPCKIFGTMTQSASTTDNKCSYRLGVGEREAKRKQ